MTSYFTRERLEIDQLIVYKYDHSYVIVYVVPMFEDNYGYILVTSTDKKVFLVDPGEPQAIIHVLNHLNLSPDIILITHRHGDHVAGNATLKQVFPVVKIYGPVYEPIPEIDVTLMDKDILNISNDANIHVIHTPCHTKGHIVFHISPNNQMYTSLLFTGDTLFVGGCGQFCQGKGRDMLNIVNELSTLPKETLIYCAHEYTLDNFRFASTVDPEYEEYLHEYEIILNSGWPSIPSVMEKELNQNIYMKCHTDNLQTRLSRKDSVASAMTELRNRNNKFLLQLKQNKE